MPSPPSGALARAAEAVPGRSALLEALKNRHVLRVPYHRLARSKILEDDPPQPTWRDPPGGRPTSLPMLQKRPPQEMARTQTTPHLPSLTPTNASRRSSSTQSSEDGSTPRRPSRRERASSTASEDGSEGMDSEHIQDAVAGGMTQRAKVRHSLAELLAKMEARAAQREVSREEHPTVAMTTAVTPAPPPVPPSPSPDESGPSPRRRQRERLASLHPGSLPPQLPAHHSLGAELAVRREVVQLYELFKEGSPRCGFLDVLAAHFPRATRREVARRAAIVGVDADGNFKPPSKRNTFTPAQRREVVNLVGSFDLDGSASIDCAELVRALSTSAQASPHGRFTEGELRQVVARYDTDQNGSICVDEFFGLVEDAVADERMFHALQSLIRSKAPPRRDLRDPASHPATASVDPQDAHEAAPAAPTHDSLAVPPHRASRARRISREKDAEASARPDKPWDPALLRGRVVTRRPSLLGLLNPARELRELHMEMLRRASASPGLGMLSGL